MQLARAKQRQHVAAQQGQVSVRAVLELLDMAIEEGAATRSSVQAVLGDQAGDLETVTAIEDRLLEVRSTLSRWRRRDHELSALFSSARELAELRDVDLLLARLVERAHDLVGTDLAYLAEFDERTGELRVRSTFGAVTRALRELRVPPGMGLASKVARTRTAQWTARYERADEVPHDPGIDAAVREEGLVSLLGVPMLAGEHVIGCLFGGNRTEHSFTAEEIALLAALADHAAVVLQTARLLEQATESAKAAERAYAQAARHATAMERAGAVHEDLTRVVLHGGSAEEVAETLSRALDRPVAIADRSLTCVASVRGAATSFWGPHAGYLPAEVRNGIEESRRTGRCVFTVSRPPALAVVVAASAGETLLGAVLVGKGTVDLGPAEQRTVERAGQIVALLTLKQDAVVDAEERVRGELVSDVLAADPVHRRELLARARARGVHLDDLRTPVVVVVAGEHRRAALRAAHAAAPDWLAGEHAGSLVVLATKATPRAAAEQVRDRICRAVPGVVLAVAAPSSADPDTLPERFELAHRCARLLPALGTRDAAVTTDGYSPYLALFGSGRQEIAAFIDATIGPLIEWDAERRTDLVATLHCFVESNASPTRTARALGLHTNTVLQRLDRITTLLGARWREPEPLFRNSVAVRLHQLSTVV